MLSITFLGHQGWMFSSSGTHVLVDPLLDASFGMVPEAGLQVYPPRKISLDAAPAISAVIFTHEHEDHFQVASLSRISREIKIVLSRKSSWAASQLLAFMGFKVAYLDEGEVLPIGELEFTAFGADLTHHDCSDEWDILPFMVRDRAHGGVFLSTVDIAPFRSSSSALIEQLRPSVVTITNNCTSAHELMNWMSPVPGGLAAIGPMSNELRMFSKHGRLPMALVCGGGWSFHDGLIGLNHSFFPVDGPAIAACLQHMMGNAAGRVLAPVPGDTIVVERDKVVDEYGAQASFIRPETSEVWPDRAYHPGPSKIIDVAPLLPIRDFTDAMMRRLRRRLNDFGRYLVGRGLFLGLNSMTRSELDGRERAYVLLVQTDVDGGGYSLAFDPRGGAFVSTKMGADAYPAGGICWASDLLAVLSGQISAPLFLMGHLLEWASEKARHDGLLSLAREIWPYAHPLRLTSEYANTYCRLSRRLHSEDRIRAK
jgi:hypothetical protein